MIWRMSLETEYDENLLEWFVLNIEKGLACISVRINDFDGALQFSQIKCKLHTFVSRAQIIERTTNETSTSEKATI